MTVREDRAVPDAPVIADVLAARYASPEMATLWSPEHKVRLERRLWLAVLRAQRDLGVDVPVDTIVSEAKEFGAEQASSYH